MKTPSISNWKDQHAKVWSLADFQGKAVLIFFGFTRCPDVCPTAMQRAKQVKALLGEQADHLQVLFISIDPEFDTAQVLQQYLAGFDKSFLGFAFSPAQTKQVLESFSIYASKNAQGQFDHAAYSFLLDPKGAMRLVVAAADSAELVAQDVRILLDD